MITFFLRYLKKKPGLLLFGICVLTIITLFLTLLPGEYFANDKIWSYDKLGHLLLFGSWTYILGLYRLIKYPEQTQLWKIFSAGLFFGAGIELMQLILPFHRDPDMLDLAYDTIGAIAAIIVLNFFPSLNSDLDSRT